MSRHLVDHRAQSDGGRLRAYYRIEKTGQEDAVHAAFRDLHRRPLSRDGAARVTQYVRIERETGV